LQIARLVLLAGLIPLFLFAINPVGQRARFMRLIIFIVFSLTIVVALLVPGIWDRLSELLGLNSGTDFLLYLVVVMLLVHIGYMHRRIRQIDKSITSIVRELAEPWASEEKNRGS